MVIHPSSDFPFQVCASHFLGAHTCPPRTSFLCPPFFSHFVPSFLCFVSVLPFLPFHSPVIFLSLLLPFSSCCIRSECVLLFGDTCLAHTLAPVLRSAGRQHLGAADSNRGSIKSSSLPRASPHPFCLWIRATR